MPLETKVTIGIKIHLRAKNFPRKEKNKYINLISFSISEQHKSFREKWWKVASYTKLKLLIKCEQNWQRKLRTEENSRVHCKYTNTGEKATFTNSAYNKQTS